jgi:hypothetical protein
MKVPPIQKFNNLKFWYFFKLAKKIKINLQSSFARHHYSFKKDVFYFDFDFEAVTL